jgi:polar amino acid transport system substrate-binding protein
MTDPGTPHDSQARRGPLHRGHQLLRRNPVISRRRTPLPVASALLLSTVTFLSACTSSAEIEADQQAGSSNAAAAEPLTVDTSPAQAERARTVVGSEVDIASLVARSLGLELDLRNISWEQWPLSLQSGDVEAVFSNVGVNAARLELFDFATYRQGIMAFTAVADSDLSIEGPEDIAGRTIAVGSGTNQERILLDWNAQDEAAGLEPATLDHYANAADALLAVQSGRVDAYLGPNPNAVYQESKGQVSVVGTVNAGWPDTTYVAATTLKGNGLVDAVEAALQHVFDDGSYTDTLARWGLSDEAVDEPVVNPQVAS